MTIEYRFKARLPRLAWIADVDLCSMRCTVLHGAWVEVSPRGFAEGLWDSEFAGWGLGSAANVFGSGAEVTGEGITFVSSTATTDYLYWRASIERCIVANSLPLLLAHLGEELVPIGVNYEAINDTIMAGIKRYERRIPTSRGDVRRLMFANLRVDSEGAREVEKPASPRFGSYVEYREYLGASYSRLAANARSNERARPMAILSTQSRGYDTTAVNAIAVQHGIDAAFTVTKGKGIGYYADEDQEHQTDDDGTGICSVLGVRAIPIERRALELDSAGEYLMYSVVHKAGDFNLQQIAEHVDRPSVILTGTLGEMWSARSWYAERSGLVNGELVRVDLGGHALTETRLEAGYVQLALPYVGARSREDVVRITESEEMNPWRLGTDYDRPIPRRIAEEAGIPRESFGQVKMASVLEYSMPVIPINEQLRAGYMRWLVANGILRRWQLPWLQAARKWNTAIRTASSTKHRLVHLVHRAISRLLGRRFRLPLIFWRLNSSLFCYCANLRAGDYKTVLTADLAAAPRGDRAR